MPRKRTQKIYFGEAQEQAVIDYIKTESEEQKNKIFNEYLREPIIRIDRKSTRLNSSHVSESRLPSSA